MQTERYGASMHVMARESWSDDRLDNLNTKVDRGFEHVDKRFEQIDRRFEQIDKRFERVDDEFKAIRREMKEGFDKMDLRFDSLNRVAITAAIAMFSGMFAGFAGLIATQL
jgi:archaellum component FlaC